MNQHEKASRGSTYLRYYNNDRSGAKEDDWMGFNHVRMKRKRTYEYENQIDEARSCHFCSGGQRCNVSHEYMDRLHLRIEKKLLHVYKMLKTQSDVAINVYRDLLSQQYSLSTTLKEIISEQEQLIYGKHKEYPQEQIDLNVHNVSQFDVYNASTKQHHSSFLEDLFEDNRHLFLEEDMLDIIQWRNDIHKHHEKVEDDTLSESGDIALFPNLSTYVNAANGSHNNFYEDIYSNRHCFKESTNIHKESYNEIHNVDDLIIFPSDSIFDELDVIFRKYDMLQIFASTNKHSSSVDSITSICSELDLLCDQHFYHHEPSHDIEWRDNDRCGINIIENSTDVTKYQGFGSFINKNEMG